MTNERFNTENDYGFRHNFCVRLRGSQPLQILLQIRSQACSIVFDDKLISVEHNMIAAMKCECSTQPVVVGKMVRMFTDIRC